EIALQQRLPVVSLVESGGANLLHQAELFVEWGRVFANMARLSAAGIPQLTVVHGSSTAGGAYLPGLSDYVVMVEDKAKVFLAGAPLVKAALGEDADEEDLGGARMHATISGTAEYVATDDAHGLHLTREILASLGWDEAPIAAEVEPPAYDPDELCGAIPADPRTPYDIREVVARVVDGSRFLEFKKGFGTNTICGHARIGDHRVGILGNNGPIHPQGSVKAAQFIQLCEQAGLPLVFLMNTTGYMVGTAAEQAGAVKHGSKMIQAVANATVPKLTIVTGGAYGAGNYGMCGRGFDPDFLFAWPNAKVAVMGGEQAATVMKIITRAKFARKGWPLDEEVLEGMTKEVRKTLDRQSSALFATARIWDDGLIDPRDTRAVLRQCLDITAAGRGRTLRPNTFGVARG
ncbi:MAG: carboxyl transferase domain-containing protein, partial [Myxococcota bacterium]|nr:carboxyl transferase domain-containing protein [Myxococcota bacterium]